jgi:hypothetical protein
LILQNKKDIEQYFFDNWTYTDVHWSGTTFDIEGKEEWVRLEYRPLTVTAQGICNTDSSYRGQIKMAILAKNEFRCFELMDLAIDMFTGTQIGSNYTADVNIIGTGLTSDRAYYYSDMLIEISTL